MATRKTASSEEILQDKGLTSESRVDEVIPEEDRLDGVDIQKINDIIQSADINKGGFIRVTRKGQFDDKHSYLCKMVPEAFDIDTIKKLYGGGDYECKTFRANGQMYKPFNFSIDPRFKGALDEQQIKDLAANGDKGGGMNATLLSAALANKPQPGLDSNPTFMSKLIETLGAKKEDSNTPLMLGFMQQMQASSQQQMQLMMTSMQESNKMMMAMMAMKSSSGDDKAMVMLLEVLKNKAESDPVEKMMGLMKQAKELVAGAPEPKEKTMTEEIVGAAVPALASLFMRGQPLAPLSPTEVITDQPPKPQVSAPQPQPDMNTMMIRMFMNQVLDAGVRGSDPALYADMIFDSVSDVQLTDIRKNLTDAAWPVNLFGADPRVTQCRPWLEQLKVMLLEDATVLEPEPAPASTSPTVHGGPDGGGSKS